jgi:hypothetical protein
MSFTGEENHYITLNEAAELTANFRNEHPSSILGEYFSKKAIMDILEQSNCVGIRIYFGEDKAHVPHFVITGVDSDENDLYTGLLAEKGWKCPPHCGGINPLNS